MKLAVKSRKCIATEGVTFWTTKQLLLLHPFNGLFSRKTGVSRYQKGKTGLDLNEARDGRW